MKSLLTFFASIALICTLQSISLAFDYAPDTNTVTINGNGNSDLDSWISDTTNGRDAHKSGSNAVRRAVLKEGITHIRTSAFEGCVELREVELPRSLQVINPQAFMDCSSLERLAVPEGVTGINHKTFAGCTALKEIILPKSLLNINAQAFAGCTSLESIVIPEKVTDLYAGIFSGDVALKDVVFQSIRPSRFIDPKDVFENAPLSVRLHFQEGADIDAWRKYLKIPDDVRCDRFRELTAPAADVVGSRSVALSETVVAGGGDVEYGIASQDGIDISWSSEARFRGLEPGTSYWFYSRVSASNTHMEAVSPASAISTKGSNEIADDVYEAAAQNEAPRIFIVQGAAEESFEDVILGGRVLRSGVDYTVREDANGLAISIAAGAIAGIGAGSYDVVIVFTDGTARAVLVVNEEIGADVDEDADTDAPEQQPIGSPDAPRRSEGGSCSIGSCTLLCAAVLRRLGGRRRRR